MSLRRAAFAAAILLLALPCVASATATDTAGSDGQLIPGSKLITAVGGGASSGAISARFADSDVALFYENDSGVDPSEAPGEFAIHEAGTAYAMEGTSFTPVAAATPSGSGSIASPWTVTSAFATPDLGITQQVSHVDGSRSLRLTWTVTNSSGVTVPFSAFWSADLYVSGSDSGTGALLAGPPRTLQGIAIDGTKAGLVEVTPWSHYYEGHWSTATHVSWDASATYDDTFDPNSIDNGFGVQWNRSLAPGASKTFVLGFNASEPGGDPVPAVAPDITQSPVSGPSHSATFGFGAHAGDTATVGYECSIDGGQFDLCTSPATFTGLGLGEHVFRVHGVNADGDNGPAASAMWTVMPAHHTTPGSHPVVGLPAVAVAGHRLEVGCKLGTGKIARCSVTLVTPSGVVVGRGEHVFSGAHQRRHGTVEVVLTAKGRARAAKPGGVRVVATVAVVPVGGSAPLVARKTLHVVARSVHVTPGALQFQSGSAVLLPSGRSYLLGLVSQLAGARRVVATGYTDSLGSAEGNYRLGLARADAVCSIIAQRAHVACRAVSSGEDHPRATNATTAGRALNRRVELQLTY
jgi:outer membrane protein OmpA-like peptidoglycan-associated protein